MTKLVRTLPVPVPAPSPKDDIYLALLDSIVGQQLSVKAADTIFARFLQLFKDGYPDVTRLKRLSEDKLRSAGLSAAKMTYVKAVADHHLKQPITKNRLAKMTDAEIIAELTRIKGVGLWTVQMILMFPMDRPDVFAVGDLIIRRMMVHHYGVTETGAAQLRRLHEIAEGWAPQRTLACKYLWKSRALVIEKTEKPKKKA